jgi:glycosyltransferase involved in cell wall biosynthesis
MVAYIKDKKLPLSILFMVVLLFVILYFYKFKKNNNVSYPIPTHKNKALTWIIHMYPPYHNAGAEWMAHCLNRYLVKEHGFTIYVFIPSKQFAGITYFDPTTTFEGVHIYDMMNREAVDHAIKHSSALCSHLDFSELVREFSKRFNKPYIHFLHNSFEYEKLRSWKKDRHATYFVANSDWIREHYQELGFPTFVLHPPVDWRDYNTDVSSDKRKYVTLINLNENKGGDFLIDLAKAMPDVSFAGVKGGYDSQIIDRNVKNIKYMNNTPNIKDIYAQTRVLIVPSKYESWGRVAVEAMSSGIPVIANNTPGLMECVGKSGIICQRENVDCWVTSIKKLLEDKNAYSIMSEKALVRAKELDPVTEMNDFVKWLSDSIF